MRCRECENLMKCTGVTLFKREWECERCGYRENEEKVVVSKEEMPCPNCGKVLVDNTFVRGSRLAGEACCTAVGCSYRIYF